MAVRTDPPPVFSIIAATGPAAARWRGRPLEVRIEDPDHRLGLRPAVALRRDAGGPDPVPWSALAGPSGRTEIFGIAPDDVADIVLLADAPTANAAGRAPRVRLRAMTFAEAALRLLAKRPHAVARILQLAAGRNWKGAGVTLAEGIAHLHAPDYGAWTAAQEAALAARAPAPAGLENGGPVRAVIHEGDDGAPAARRQAARERTRASLRAQSVRCMEMPQGPGGTLADGVAGDGLVLHVCAGTVLHPQALERMAAALLADPQTVAVYGDHDHMDADGTRRDPVFRPAWNRPLVEAGYLSLDPVLVRHGGPVGTGERMPGRDAIPEGWNGGTVLHLPLVLAHRTVRPPPHPLPAPAVPRRRAGGPQVSVIIPTRDRADLLSACLDGLFHRSGPADLDVIVMDNESREQATLDLFERGLRGRLRRVAVPGSFNFARACNLGVAAAHHESILLLNNDVEPLAEDWLAALCAELEDETVGAVGALLLYPGGPIQHAGVALGGVSVAHHLFHFVDPDAARSEPLLALRRDGSAVTAACLLTRKSVFEAVGGMDEERLAVAFNDVDYGLKLADRGLRCVWTPAARLLHRESVSRGPYSTPEKRAQLAAEERAMAQRWGRRLRIDPLNSPNATRLGVDLALVARPADVSPRKGFG